VAALEAVLAAGGKDAAPGQQHERFFPQLQAVLAAAFQRVAACCERLGGALRAGGDGEAAARQAEDWAGLQQRMRSAALASLADYWDRLKSAPKGSHVVALHTVGGCELLPCSAVPCQACCQSGDEVRCPPACRPAPLHTDPGHSHHTPCGLPQGQAAV
jgi:hypothetical protein